ncbi:mandelate racemase/muconate lactonizing enzyme family protein [candidate division KSB1 bacterium]|nr:mandelate racemase/muconate lactonizing enzyme family protein [candidate division KSB1 bacterium]
MKITRVNSNFEREPYIRPFGFKGGYCSEAWQTVAMLENETGLRGVGLCTQNTLWSDADVFTAFSESGGNALMYAMLEHGLQLVKGQSFSSPVDMLEFIWPRVYEYGKKITGRPHLRETFALNALVGLDNAAWLLYALENNITDFDKMIPAEYKPALSYRHSKIASIPLMAYAVPLDEIKSAVKDGYFFMKIKIGSPGSPDAMLEWDKQRVEAIHKAIGHVETPYTKNGKIPYYFDANGRYPDKETLSRLLDFLKKIGAFEQIAIVEEPFPEEYEADVSDLGVRIAADESAHTDKDAKNRIDMGYGAIALKAIAKTLSMTLKIAHVAFQNNIPCFCADLTVNPVLVEWNKNVAARLAPLPGLEIGLLETNGHQNYKNWAEMKKAHPFPETIWASTRNGVFELDENYYHLSGGIFEQPERYSKLVFY